MENSLKEVKSIIRSNIEVLKKAKPTSVKNIEDFFEFTSGLPLVTLYTKEGIFKIEEKLYNTSAEYQSEVIEFILRIKPSVMVIENVNDICRMFLQKDIILDKIYTNTDKESVNKDEDENELNKLDIDKIEDYYLLNLILAYNTVIL